MTTFFISDTHFFHHKIITYCNRPFSTPDEMNRYMSYQWNKRVLKDDIVIHGGDFAHKHDPETTLHLLKRSDIVNRLNGKKYLVKGNHDPDAEDMKKLGFIDVMPYWLENGVFVHHFPSVTSAVHEGVDFPFQQYSEAETFLYGHVHNNPHRKPKKGINISAEVVDYIPRTLVELLEKRN